MSDQRSIRHCSGTGCDWASHCGVALRPREYATEILVPNKENTADRCNIYVPKGKNRVSAWGVGSRGYS